MVQLTRSQFEALVEGALHALPEEIRRHMDNVAVTVADWPDPSELARLGPAAGQVLGLYQGIPLTQRRSSYTLVAPDKITLFQCPLEAISKTVEELRERISRTLVHEVGHHFGLDDARIMELGRKR